MDDKLMRGRTYPDLPKFYLNTNLSIVFYQLRLCIFYNYYNYYFFSFILFFSFFSFHFINRGFLFQRSLVDIVVGKRARNHSENHWYLIMVLCILLALLCLVFTFFKYSIPCSTISFVSMRRDICAVRWRRDTISSMSSPWFYENLQLFSG